MLRMDDRIGTVRAGRLADLVILNRDPTGDLGALRDIAAVFKGGTLAWSRDGAWG
jgi:imidazolonepropionase-like amidohydrolase